MLRRLTQVLSGVTAVIVALIAYGQLSFVEQDFPLGTEHSATILFSASGMDRQAIVDGFLRVGREYHLDIYLGAAAEDDPFFGIDVFALGANQPQGPSSIPWLNAARHGTLYPASALGEQNLSAVYVMSGPAEGLQALETWAVDNGADLTWHPGGPAAVFLAGLIYGGAGLPLFALLVVGITLILAWFASRAEARAVRLLAGTSGARIQAQDLIGWLSFAAPPVLVGVLAIGVAFGAWRGWANGLALAVVSLLYAVILGAVTLLFGMVASCLTKPSVRSLALREPPESRFEFPSQLLKAVALTLGIAALPALLWQAQASLRESAIQARTVHLRPYVTQAVGGAPMETLDQRRPDFGRLVTAVEATDTMGYAEIVNRGDLGPEFNSSGFDGIALVNTHYLKALGISPETDLNPVPVETANRLLAILESQDLGGLSATLRHPGDTAANGLAPYSLKAGEGLVAPSGTGLGFKQSDRPLILVSDRISHSLSDDSLFSAMTSGNIIFRDADAVLQEARTLGLTHLLQARSRVTDSALLAAQFANQVALTIALSIGLLLIAVLVSGWLSARVYAVNNSRFIYPMLTYGRTWWEVLRRRVVTEVGLLVLTFVIVSAVYLALGFAWSPVMLVGLALYIAFSVAVHQRAVLDMIRRVSLRIH